jgi:F-type H+-transporting ATPase subunit delta
MAAIENRYAEALLRIAIENEKVDEYEAQLEDLYSLVSCEELDNVLKHPDLNCEKKKKLMEEILKDKYSPHILSFYMILIDSGRYKCLSNIINEYKKMADAYRNISNVKIISASELSDDEVEKLKQSIQKSFNLRDIKVEKVIDPKAVGGVMIKIGDTVIDGTVKERLDKLKNAIINSKLCAD